MSIGVLGPIVFEVNADKVLTFQDASRSGDARWHTHDVFMGKPKQEFIGPGLESFTLQVRLDIALGVIPRDEIRTMREQRDTGAVLQFTLGGELVGEYTLEKISEDFKRWSRTGVLNTAIVSLSLKEYA